MIKNAPFFIKIYGAYVFLICLTSFLVYFLVSTQIEKDFLSQKEQALKVNLMVFANDLKENEFELDDSKKKDRYVRYGNTTEARYTLIDQRGEVLFDTEKNADTMDNHQNRPELMEAKGLGQGTSTRFSKTLNMSMMYIAQKLVTKSNEVYFLRVAVPLSDLRQRLSYLKKLIIFGASLAAIIAVLLGYFFAKRITAPLDKMTQVAELISQGNFDQKVEIDSTDEVGTLAQALNRMVKKIGSDMEELKKLETVRKDFIANVSHELKTPITAILAMVESMLDDEEMDREMRSRFHEKIKGQTLRLSDLVSDLLTLSRLESSQNHLEKERLSLKKLVKTSINTFLPSLEKKQLKVELFLKEEEDYLIFADQEAIRQVIDNLLSNAIKYSPKGMPLQIGLNKNTEHVLFSVKDFGLGIRKEYLERIFERFFRVDQARSRELGGTGLGLSIVKHVVRAHGGRVWVESTEGAGSQFFVALPS